MWDADIERSLNALRFVALNSGLIENPTDELASESFTEVYRRAREEYTAPLPRWDPTHDGHQEAVPQLSPAEVFLKNGAIDGVDVGTLAAAGNKIENLVREAVGDTRTPTVVQSLPATGKTTGAIKTVADSTDEEADGTPLSHLSYERTPATGPQQSRPPGADAVLLPVFSEKRLSEEVRARSRTRSGARHGAPPQPL